MSIQKVVVGKRTRWKVRWLEAGRHRQVTFDFKGDAVNLAARLQEEAKKRGVRALLSGPARERVPEADLEALGPLGIHSHPAAEGWGWR